jgi:hypothetical protein
LVSQDLNFSKIKTHPERKKKKPHKKGTMHSTFSFVSTSKIMPIAHSHHTTS